MAEVVVIGNISIDIYFRGESLTFLNNRFQLAVGGKYFVDRVIETVGGSGANVAIGLSKNRITSSVIGKIGNNPFRQIIVEKLKREGVETNLCQVEEDYLNISAILLTPKGERSIIHYTTPHRHIFSHHGEYSPLKSARAVFLGNHPDISLEEKERILGFLHDHNRMTFLNIGVADCRKEKKTLLTLLRKTQVLILNGHEFSELVKAPYKDIHFRENIIDWYIPELGKQLVVVTDGEKGSYAYQDGAIYHQNATKPDAIKDTTGAGDGFSAGFIAEYLISQDVRKSLEKGSSYAAKILSKIGAN